jgi:hypothetical protein
MGQSRVIQAGLGLMLLQCMSVAVALPFVNESLTYRAHYQGIFSAQKMIGIADVGWKTSSIDVYETGEPAIETRMTVSSEAYPFVETLYPFRLMYRSLTLPGPVRTIAYEKYDNTERHGRDLTWLDEKSGAALRFREGYVPTKKKTTVKLPEVLENWGSQQQDYQYYTRARHKSLPWMVDQMSLLQRIRESALSVGSRFKVPVTDGKRSYVYKVRVVSDEVLTVANRKWNALKIRFDGYRLEDGKVRDHDPLWVWLDNTPRRTPLRFEYRNALGRFVITLQASDS